MRGRDHFSLCSGYVIWKEQKTLTFATSNISFTVFLHLVGGSCMFLQKRIFSGHAAKAAVCVLGKGCLGWLTCAQELLGSAFTT